MILLPSSSLVYSSLYPLHSNKSEIIEWRIRTSNNHASMHACIHTYILTYIHTYIHIYIHTYIHTCIHTYMYNKEDENLFFFCIQYIFSLYNAYRFQLHICVKIFRPLFDSSRQTSIKTPFTYNLVFFPVYKLFIYSSFVPLTNVNLLTLPSK